MKCIGLCCAVLSALAFVAASNNNEPKIDLTSLKSPRLQRRTASLDLCSSNVLGSPSDSGCVDCFCNGFSDTCAPDAGWYQAQVDYSLSVNDTSMGGRFTTNGILEQTEEYLSVQPDLLSNSVYLSFPSEFLGNKRTAYGQSLTFNLSVNGQDPSQCVLSLELESGLSFRTRHKLRTVLPTVGPDPVGIEVPLTAGEFIYDRYYFRRKATQMDVRKTLSDIRMLRLVLSCDQPHTLRLYSSSLNFATSNTSSDGPAQQPLEEVSYVERCTCPSNRVGANCEGCAQGYTTDPPFGGEFALCVRCFCSFQSTMCNPLSGVCTNCTGNTMGRDCEQCIEGYDRAQPLTILPCDQCADGFWDSGGGVCIPCNCHSLGSLSSVCDKSSGVCSCAEGFAGDRCDACIPSSSGTFPNCQPCDECTTQWQDRITPLGEEIENTIEFISSLNLTNGTDAGIAPELNALFALIAEIRSFLNGSMIDLFASDVNLTHTEIRSLLERTQTLCQRAKMAFSNIQGLESLSVDIAEQLELIPMQLEQLEMEFQNISRTFDRQDFSSVDVDQFLQLARSALERSERADQIIQQNVTSLLNQTIDAFALYNDTLISSNLVSIQAQLTETLAIIDSRVEVYRVFIAESNSALCGAENSTEVNCTLQCGGVACDTCGGSSCDSLLSDSFTALNISQRAVSVAEQTLARIQIQIDELRSFLSEVELSLSSATEVERFANGSRERAEAILRRLEELVAQLERELDRDRIDPDEIGRMENMTLALQHELSLEEFLDLLIQINSTIDDFFSGGNVSEDNLRRRVEEALQRALRADELAQMIVMNATRLEEQLQLLSGQLLEAQVTANDTEELVEQAEEAIVEAVGTLNSTEELVGSLESLLSGLNGRLDLLEAQIGQNLRELAIARNLTAIAVRVANETETESLSAEAEFESLREGVQVKYNQSVADREASLDIQNRTATLQRLTQDQLLQVENLERTRSALFTEQEEIRSDVARVANELETLDQNIRVHIARNTACLDTGTLSKKKRRRRSIRSRS